MSRMFSTFNHLARGHLTCRCDITRHASSSAAPRRRPPLGRFEFVKDSFGSDIFLDLMQLAIDCGSHTDLRSNLGDKRGELCYLVLGPS
jgi:hypothetical protein